MCIAGIVLRGAATYVADAEFSENCRKEGILHEHTNTRILWIDKWMNLLQSMREKKQQQQRQ